MYLCVLFILFPLIYGADVHFSRGISVGSIDTTKINEASGIAASRVHKDVLYTHNDGGDSARIFAINAKDASLIAVFGISGADHYDWEDIAVAPCQGSNKSCIYIADAGHSRSRKVNMVYMVHEPGAVRDQTLTVANKLPFTWTEDDGQTLMVDNNGEVYLVSNVLGANGLMVHLPSDGWGSSTPVNVTASAHLNISTSHHDPGAGDISYDGTEVLIKTRNHVFYWKVQNNDYLCTVVTEPIQLPHLHESLGESICWSPDAMSYYTISEGTHQNLHKFTRLPSGPAVG